MVNLSVSLFRKIVQFGQLFNYFETSITGHYLTHNSQIISAETNPNHFTNSCHNLGQLHGFTFLILDLYVNQLTKFELNLADTLYMAPSE